MDHSSSLWELAELGLKEILHQFSVRYDGTNGEFYISPQQAEDAIAAFQKYANAASSDLAMKGNPETNRYPWGYASSGRDGWRVLTDIARRLEALVGNEAVSERTNSAMKRLLAPFRLKMGHGILISRLTLARHGAPTVRSPAAPPH